MSDTERESLHWHDGCLLGLDHVGGHKNPSFAYQSLPSHFSFFVQAPAAFFLFSLRPLKGIPTFWEHHTLTRGKPL